MSDAAEDQSALEETLQERRRFRRVYRPIPGRVYVPGTSEEATCTIEDISAGGAKVGCKLRRRPCGQVILYAGDLGRIEGHVVNASENGFTASFSISRKRRSRLVDQLTVELNRHLLNGADQCEGRSSESDG
jgi:hypothetical protein